MTTLEAETTLDADEARGGRSAVAEAIAPRSTGAEEEGTALVRRAQAGDADAFDALARERIDGSYRLAFAILRSEMDARDAVQDAYVSAWRQMPKLREPGRFDAWLDRIIVNRCRMALRHRRVVHVHEVAIGDPAPDLAITHRMWVPPSDRDVANADAVERAFEHLDPDQRSLLVLHHVQERPIDEIAAILGIPSGTVKWRLHQARTRLQRALEEETR